MKKILVIGASGLLARPVVRQLLQEGYDLTLGGRDSKKLNELFPGVKAIEVDVLNKDGLAAVFKGQEIIHMNFSVAQNSRSTDPQPEREGVANVIEVARQTGINRLSYLSSLIKDYEGMNGFHWWVFKIKNAAIGRLKESGIPYSIFYPSTFMETFDGQTLRGNKIMLGSGSRAKMWFIAGKDYAKQVARAFQIAGNQNQEYNVQGLEGYNFDEAAKIFIGNYKKPLKIMKAPVGVLKFLGNFNQKINYGYHILEALNKYPEEFVSEKTWVELGKPSVTIADYSRSL